MAQRPKIRELIREGLTMRKIMTSAQAAGAGYPTASRYEGIKRAHRFSHIAMMTFCVRIIGNVIK